MGGIRGNQDIASFYMGMTFVFYSRWIFTCGCYGKWNLHTRIALSILKHRYDNCNDSLGFMISTALLSMFVSNTAAVMIMIPIGLAIIKEAHVYRHQVQNDVKLFEKHCTGIAMREHRFRTLIGTPPLIILAGQMKQIFDVELNFAQWMLIGAFVIVCSDLLWLT